MSAWCGIACDICSEAECAIGNGTVMFLVPNVLVFKLLSLYYGGWYCVCWCLSYSDS